MRLNLIWVNLCRALLTLLAVFHVSGYAGAYDDFFIAVKNDQTKKVAYWLARGFDPNTLDLQGNSALIIALRESSQQSFQLLLQLPDININQPNLAQETPLMYAAIQGNLEATKDLLHQNAEVNKTGWTALHYAAIKGHTSIVQILLEHSAYIDAESPDKNTPLMLAARYGHTPVVKLLLEQGADMDIRNNLNLDVVQIAFEVGNVNLATALEKRRSSLEAQKHSDRPWLLKSLN